jgi:hypothetical protein
MNNIPIQNDSKEFVGVEELKRKHAEQVNCFELWAANRDWRLFHRSHYDWWTFPISKPSSYGLAYTIYQREVDLLKQDEFFMQKFRLGLKLLALSWGWDIYRRDHIKKRDRDQSWLINLSILFRRFMTDYTGSTGESDYIKHASLHTYWIVSEKPTL